MFADAGKATTGNDHSISNLNETVPQQPQQQPQQQQQNLIQINFCLLCHLPITCNINGPQTATTTATLTMIWELVCNCLMLDEVWETKAGN
mmetsp:Transcript_26799/g.55438  ORF Transcript_26799/g.55438 Transcript_26799/m.55438 type:complete len:91 (-) Transcript_26799:64-336(-)